MFQSSGLFGNTSSQPSSTPGTSAPAGGLFGTASAGKTQTSAPASSLFGGTLGASTAPATSTPAPFSLFSNTTSSAAAVPSITVQPAAGTSTGGLFGSTNNTSTSAPSTGGLFGTTNTNTTTGGTTGGLFGSSTTAQPAQATSSLFGGLGNSQQQQQQQPAQTGGLFGAGAGNNATTSTSNPGFKPLFSTLGGSAPLQQSQNQTQQQQQQTIPGVKVDVNNVKPTTRFYELHESLQQEIIQAEDFIQSQIDSITKCEVFIPAHGVSLTLIAPDVKFVRNKLDTVSQALSGDAGEINAVKGVLVQDIEDCQKEFKAIEHLKLPAQWQYNSQWTSAGDGSEGENVFAATDMVPYFNRHTSEMDARLKKYTAQLAEIEAHLRTVEGNAVEQMHKVMQRQATGDQERGQIAELASAMHVFEEAVLRVASKVGETREGVIDVTLGGMYPNGSTRR